ncbi:Uncharacterized protein Adt_31966 [Abeliophyllum distichum]|uniref:Thionin-like protein 2 n=1 Tax=Abeliophyllum distichum TaxID=126358 RepID=A0ABD1RFL5_9LAMI
MQHTNIIKGRYTYFYREKKRWVSMGRNGISRILVAMTVVVAMVASGVSGQSIYACWGGCYNVCFLGSGKSSSEMYPCYLKCVNTCIPRTADDYRRFCATGCSLEICIPFTDGANKDECFERCTNLCKI